MKYKSIIALICCSFILIFLVVPQKGYAQRYLEGGTSFWNNVSITGNVGTTLFFGDVSSQTSPFQEDWQLGYGAIVRKQFSDIFGLGFQFMNGQLHGTKLNYEGGGPANLIFEANIMEFNIHTVLNFSNLIMGYKPERILNVYGYIGLGIANWNSTLKDFENNAVIATNGFDDAGLKAWTPEMIYPVGLGLNIMMNQRFDINIDAGLRLVNSDAVDALSSGDANNDYYSFASIGLTYKLSGAGGIFKSSRNKEINYDKEARKQQRYQDRLLRKDEKRSQRKKLEEERIEEKLHGKNTKKTKRKNRDNGFPQVVEYDAVYTYSQALKLNNNINAVKAEVKETIEAPEIIIDEGKHFITGVQTGGNKQDKPLIKNVKNTTLNSIILGSTNDAAINIPNQGLVYTVQILATRVPGKNLLSTKSKYRIDKQLYVFKSGSLYRYSAGLFNTYQEALTYSRQLHFNGLSDAFVTSYKNGIKIQRTK